LINNNFWVERESEETSVKVHCVSNATRIIPRPKRCHGNIPRSNMSQNVTGSFKELDPYLFDT
jgi:hypothetical protein